jgi:hypothetical protein
MGLVILLIQMLRVLLLSFALALFKIAEVLEEHCNSISGEASNEGDRISIGDSTSTNDDLTLKEPEGDEAGEPMSSHEASANCAEDVVIVSPKPDTAAAEPKAAMVSHQTQTENATLKYSPQGKQSVPQITGSRGIRQLIRVRFPSSTSDGPSAAGAAPSSYIIRYNGSGAFPYRNAVSPVVVLSSHSTGSFEDFKPKPDLRYNFPSCNGPAAKIEPVQMSLMSPQLLSQKGLSESAMSNRTFHATPVAPVHASRAASPCSEISSETSDDTSLPSHEDILGKTDQQLRNLALAQPFMPKTPDSHDKLRKERDYLNPYDSPGRDSGYASGTESITGTPNTAPRSDAPATPEIIVSRPGAPPNSEHLKELRDMNGARRVWKKLVYYHPQWLVGAIPLKRLSTEPGWVEHSDVQMLVLDRQEGKYILLEEALSSKDLRARTGLGLALYDNERGKFITQLDAALILGTPLEKITASIHMWNRKTSLFEDLADMLRRPDWRATTGLRIQHSTIRHSTSPTRAAVLSWPDFVRTSDIVEYYLGILCNFGVVVNAQMDCYNGPMHHCLGSGDDEGMELHEAFGQTCTQT